MGDSPYHIFGSCPPEVLHLFELGFSVFVYEMFEILLPPSILAEVNEYAISTSYMARHQSDSKYPNINVFAKGLTKVSLLKAREKHERLFLLYLCLLNSGCVKRILHGKKHVSGLPPSHLKTLFKVIEMSLIVHNLLNADRMRKSSFVSSDNHTEPKATLALKRYMVLVKKLAHLTNYNLMRPKFHQLLHFIHYIKEYGVPANFDGSRCESFGKEIFKHSAFHTTGSKPTFNFDTASRMYERKIVQSASKVYFQKEQKIISKYAPVSSLNPLINAKRRPPKIGGAKFVLFFEESMTRDLSQDSIVEKNITFEWTSRTNDGTFFPLSTILMVQQKLFINPIFCVGRLESYSKVHGFT